MSEPVFLPSFTPISLAEVAAALGIVPAESARGERLFHGLAALDEAGPGDISFLDPSSPDHAGNARGRLHRRGRRSPQALPLPRSP